MFVKFKKLQTDAFLNFHCKSIRKKQTTLILIPYKVMKWTTCQDYPIKVQLFVMPSLCSFFINFGIFMGFILKFIKLIQLRKSFLSRCFRVHVQLLHNPISFMFQLNRKMTWFTIDYPIWEHLNGCFESCVMCL